MNRLPGGFLVSLEGVDGAGKSTLLTRIVTHFSLAELMVVGTKEPGGTVVGEAIKKVVLYSSEKITNEAEFLLYAADRAHHFSTVILPALEQGAVVISDRLADSSMAYQGYGRGVDRSMIRSINRWAMQGRLPDLVIYLRLSPEEASRRRDRRGEERSIIEKEDDLFFNRVVEGFEDIFSHKRNVVMIEATRGVDEITEIAVKAIEKHLMAKIK